MSLVGKHRALFSYKNDDRSGSTFQYKDFEKTKSYNSKFVHAKFIGTSLRAAHMKYCNFDNYLFDQVDFVGTNMRGSSFIVHDAKTGAGGLHPLRLAAVYATQPQPGCAVPQGIRSPL